MDGPPCINISEEYVDHQFDERASIARRVQQDLPELVERTHL